MAKAKDKSVTEAPIKQIERKVHFYELHAVNQDDYEIDARYDSMFQELLSKIVLLVRRKDSRRYQPMGDRLFFINEIIFQPESGKRIIKGKLLSVRKDFFPELMNTDEDTMRDIDADDVEGIVETTHFMIQEKNANRTNKVRICIEYNLYGAKINDLVYYLMALGTHLNILKSLKPVPIIRNQLSKIKDRIGEISKLKVRVKSDNIDAIDDVDTGIATVFHKSKEEFDQEYLTLEFKYDYYESKDKPQQHGALKAKSVVGKFIDWLIDDNENAEKLETLEVVAQDSEKHDRLQTFDLLVDKVKDDFKIQRKEKSRTLISEDMFDKMISSFIKQRL